MKTLDRFKGATQAELAQAVVTFRNEMDSEDPAVVDAAADALRDSKTLQEYTRSQINRLVNGEPSVACKPKFADPIEEAADIRKEMVAMLQGRKGFADPTADVERAKQQCRKAGRKFLLEFEGLEARLESPNEMTSLAAADRIFQLYADMRDCQAVLRLAKLEEKLNATS
jgi:hypothetical protein